ncbi:unnamed protein product [Malus baccata var. baccata]
MAQVDFNHSTYLSPEQLRKIARILYYQEAEAIKNIQFKYEAKFLEPWFNNDDKDQASIVNAANHPLQFVRNFHHVDGLPAHLDDVLTNKELELARKASEFRNDMMEIARGSQSPASRQYSWWIKETGSVPQNHICIRAGKYQCNRVLLGAAGIAVLIFSAGIVWEIFSANNPLQTVARDARSCCTMGHRCYVAQLPDGSVLARQIAHQQS